MLNGRPVAPDVLPQPWEIARQAQPDKLAYWGDLAVATGIANMQTGNAAESERCAKVLDLVNKQINLLTGQATERSESVNLTLTASLATLQSLANRAISGGSTQPELIDTTSDLVICPPDSDDVTKSE